MSFIESSFISLEEYTSSEGSRLSETNLKIGELYSAMFTLAANKQNREAAKIQLKLRDLVIIEAGRFSVRVALLDRNLRPVIETVGTFEEGYWQHPSEDRVIFTDMAVRNYRDRSLEPTIGYIKPYINPPENKLVSDGPGLGVTDPNLVLV